MTKRLSKVLILVLVLSLILPAQVFAQADDVVTFTILHTNDFHGNLEPAGSNPGAAKVATVIKTVRTEVGADKVLLLDGGDEMQGSLLSNLQQGVPTIAYYNAIGYDAATFGNHEFDWGQTVLADRMDQAIYPYLAANLTAKVDGQCTWDPATFNPTAGDPITVEPYRVFDRAGVKVAVIGVTSTETPYITIASATEGLCFQDPTEAILRVYDAVDAQADVIVVLSHLGYTDGGYGYGFSVYGDQTLAERLVAAGKPVDLIIGGHSHTNLNGTAKVVEGIPIVQAHYAGRRVGRADITVNKTTGDVSVAWTDYAVPGFAADPEIEALIATYVNDEDYQALISQEFGYSQVDLVRNYNGDNTMGAFVNDAIYNYFNEDLDGDPELSVDMVFNNPGGLRVDLCATEECTTGLHDEPFVLTYGMLFSVLPFGNQTVIGDMTGAQILELLNQAASLNKGAIQVAGVRYKFWAYSEAADVLPYAWGAYDVEVKEGDTWVPLDLEKTYKVATNEFLAPAGQDNFYAFKYMTNISYYGDMLDQVTAYSLATYTEDNPYKGPDGNGGLDGRITRNGDGDHIYEEGEIIPVTILHHNDSHGRLADYAKLATLIKEERAKNPDRTILLTAGDNIQGDSMMYYFKSAGLGYSADGKELPEELKINPIIKVFNAMDYDAMTLGNHEFNFGKEVFSTLKQATFPILQANITDTGEFGLDEVPVVPSTVVDVDGINIAILGIGNHRISIYELPSNIPGLSFQNPIEVGKEMAPDLAAANDAVIALTHIGFAPDPNSVEVDNNVDTVFAAEVPGVDVIVGGHSHTEPASGSRYLPEPYKYLPTIVVGPDDTPVLIGQANRYNTYLGKMFLGFEPTSEGVELISRAGAFQKVEASTPADPEIAEIIKPYEDLLLAYNETVIGETDVPIDTLKAYTQETNGANLQADASVWKLTQEGIEVDFHLSGAMTNSLIAETAAPDAPYTLKIQDMFRAMPYENSLVVLRMNGPQLKQILERAYRNYYYYKYVPGYGGYSYYTTCMLDINAGGKIIYNDAYPATPNGNNVVGLRFGDTYVDFRDADTYYNVSTVNYLAAGSCNFNNQGQTLWPLDQVVADTQYYVRDSVIEYVQAMEKVSPAVEGRLVFDGQTIWMPVIGRFQ